MSHTPTLAHPNRRQLMRGAAWATPTIALASLAPAAAASTTPQPTSSGGFGGGTDAGSLFEVGDTIHYSTTAGRLIRLSVTTNMILFDKNHQGSVSYFWDDYAYGHPTLTLSDGRVFEGTTTAGPVSSGIADLGSATSFTIVFSGSDHFPEDHNAKVSVPFRLVFTDPDWSVHNAYYRLTYTLNAGKTEIVTKVTDAVFTKIT